MSRVTDGHQHQYRGHGYCVVEGLIPAELIAAARRRTLEIVDQRPEWPANHFQILDPQRYRSKGDDALPAGIQRPAQYDESFRAVADHDNLVAAMSGLLEGAVERFTDQIGVKHDAVTENQGGRSFHHQDSFYWHIEPQLGCNCWIPLSDVGADRIALAVVPGSQRGWQLIEHESYYDDPPMGHLRDGEFKPFQRHRIPLDQAASAHEVLLPMRAGDGLFFTNYTWHRSEPNRSGETCAFYAIAYQRTADERAPA